MRRKLALVVPLFLLLAVSIACAQFTPKNSKPHGRIIYQSDQDGNFDLYSLDVSGGDPERLTSNSSNDVSPAYIRASKEIGFISDRQEGWNIYVMDAQGDNSKAITEIKDLSVDYPSWSPDGKTIAASLVENCAEVGSTCYYDIYTLNADGRRLKNLTNTPESEWVPVWSPDGKKIAFYSDRGGDSEIYVMDRDGSNVVQLTDNQGYDGRPNWSPNGKKILFETDRDGGDWDIYLMNADGSNPQPVTENSTNDFTESWSPDGNWVVYLSDADGDAEIYIIDIHGENQQRLTNNTLNEISPIWAP